MIILDENVSKSQRRLLLDWHIPVRQVGYDIGRVGMQDEEIIRLLHQLRRSTFFTFDLDFYKRTLRHQSYCIVFLYINPNEGAKYIRRLVRHDLFDTQAKRLGNVMEVTTTGLLVWHPHAEQRAEYVWDWEK